jgi:hypothetical protein
VVNGAIRFRYRTLRTMRVLGAILEVEGRGVPMGGIMATMTDTALLVQFANACKAQLHTRPPGRARSLTLPAPYSMSVGCRGRHWS